MIADHAKAVYDNWSKPLYPDIQKEVAIKLLKLRIDFKENASPVKEGSKMNVDILNRFKVPFRLESNVDGVDGTVILLRGEKNMNTTTKEWFGFHGFPARVIGEAKTMRAKDSGSSFKLEKQQQLNVKIIDVDEWKRSSEIDRMAILENVVLDMKMMNRKAKAKKFA